MIPLALEPCCDVVPLVVIAQPTCSFILALGNSRLYEGLCTTGQTNYITNHMSHTCVLCHRHMSTRLTFVPQKRTNEHLRSGDANTGRRVIGFLGQNNLARETTINRALI